MFSGLIIVVEGGLSTLPGVIGKWGFKMALNDQRNVVDPNINATYQGWAGNYMKFYNDGSEASTGSVGAFHDIYTAISDAEDFVFIVDWSFHPTFTLQRERVEEQKVGELLLKKAHENKDLLIAIMPWEHTNIWGLKVFTGDTVNNKGGEILKQINTELNIGNYPDNLLWKSCNYGTTNTYSHHQKFVVLDSKNKAGKKIVKAFWGGLDITRGRFDWQEHPILASNNTSFADDWYNGEFGNDLNMVREPWHDIHAQVVGPTAWDFIYEFVARWSYKDSTGGDVLKKLVSVLKSGEYIAQSSSDDVDPKDTTLDAGWRGQIVHSMNKVAWCKPTDISSLADPYKTDLTKRFTWKFGSDYEKSVQLAYLEMIKSADEYIYIETQYLISSGDYWVDERSSVANLVAEKVVGRIEDKIDAGREFHVYVVLPMYPEGKPDDMIFGAIRNFEWRTIEYMIKRVDKACRDKIADSGQEYLDEDHKIPKYEWSNYIMFYCLANWNNVFTGQVPGGEWTNVKMYPADITKRTDKIAIAQRYMIYVHSKLMLADDKFGIIGSANLNERSLNGNRDSEICAAFWNNDQTTPAAQLTAFRKRLWTEHLGAEWLTTKVFKVGGVLTENGDLNPGSGYCAQAVLSAALNNFTQFMKGQRTPEEKGHLLCFPVNLVDGELVFDQTIIGNVPNEYIPDYPEDNEGDLVLWKWIPDPNLLRLNTKIPFISTIAKWITNSGTIAE